MATVTKFQDFSEQLAAGVHDLSTGTAMVFKVALTNSAPLATNTILANITQISGANGYTTGGETTTITVSETGGTTTVQGTQVTWTAAGGAMGDFRYIVLYNDTATAPADALIQFYDHGSTVSLSTIGDSYVFSFNGTSPGTILTLA